jgi:thioredoxin reductase (NADPH)
VENTRNQAKNLGVEFQEDEIFHISWNGGLALEGRAASYEAKAVLLATGSERKTAKVPGIRELEGRGVSYCAICDAFFYRGKDVALLGNEEYAIHEMGQLLPVVKSVTLLTNGEELKAEVPANVRVIETPLASVDGSDTVEGVTFTDGASLETAGVFVALGSAGAAALARKAGAMTEGRNIRVNDKMETNVPGLYAAGDCTGGLLQISKAVGEGAVAAMSMISFVRRK